MGIIRPLGRIFQPRRVEFCFSDRRVSIIIPALNIPAGFLSSRVLTGSVQQP